MTRQDGEIANRSWSPQLEFKCPHCSSKLEKVIYMGFPMELCEDEQCGTVYGFWTWVLEIYFDGCFMTYEGSYLKALWGWLTDGEE